MVIIITFCLIFFIGIEIFIIDRVDTYSKEYKEEVTFKRISDYESKIKLEVDSKFKLLNSLGSFFYEDYLSSDEINNILAEININNDFTSIYFVDTLGDVFYYTNESLKHQREKIENLNSALLECVNESFNDKNAISSIYSENNEAYIAYASCVKYNDEIEGVIVASYSLISPAHIFNDLLIDKRIFEKIGFVYNDGTVICSDFLGVGENIFNYDDIFFNSSNIYQMMQNDDFFNVQINYDKERYACYFKPIKDTNWYIMYTDVNYVSGEFYYILMTSKILLMIFMISTPSICLIIFLITYKNRKKLEKVAYFDSLTGAYNFTMFRKKIKVKKFKAVANLTIQRFRYVNMEFGSQLGNKLLCMLSDVIASNLNHDEIYARESGDNFWLAINRSSVDDIVKLYEKIRQDILINAEQVLGKYSLDINCGVALVSKDNMNIIECARISLRETKIKNKNLIVYGNDNNETEKMKRYIDGKKNIALFNNEFKLYFQPKLNYATKEFDSAEVLVRWHTSEGEILYPNQFIKIFEELGFIANLDLYIFEESCRFLQQFNKKTNSKLKLSINQSKVLFYKTDYVDTLCKIADKYNVDHSMITLELLETIEINNFMQFKNIISKIRDSGFKVSLDDFGSGYSTLNLLNHITIDEIKIDREFVKNYKNKQNYLILQSITKIAKMLNAIVVAEGIENEEQEKTIRSLNIDYGQGYFYSKPNDMNQFIEFIKKNKTQLF